MNLPPTIIGDAHVYWEMDWGKNHPTKPEKEMLFERDIALARLLADEIIFLSNYWWESDWLEAARKATCLNVNCNDVFAWGCADSQEICIEEIQGLYDLWLESKTWGATKWCCFKRNEKPQAPVVKYMKAAGVWDDKMEQLPDNNYDALVKEKYKNDSIP